MIRKNFLFSFILFLLTLTITSQTKIKGVVKDVHKNIIPSANIQILNSEAEKTIAFGICDDSGSFAIAVKSYGTYTIKITFLGYETLYKKVDFIKDSNSIFEFILTENKNQLDELIIKSQSTGMKQKGDTLIYAVEKFMNGTEETLKDIIKRLPGLDINANGKITSNGKEVDKLLLDGEEFFRNQHQLATENITSEMIKNVELIKNYKDFGKIDTDKKSGLTAVNINIKDEFKKRISGNLETAAGYKEKYRLHSNLFYFGKELKSSLIIDDNNTGKQAISLQDYFSLIDDKDSYGSENKSNVKFSKAEDFPKFLTSQNNVKERKTNFAALNLVYSPNNKLKINFNSIFNKANQEEEQFLKQQYFTLTTPILNNEFLNSTEISLFNSTQIESFYKPNKKTVFKYLINTNLNNINTAKNGETLVSDYANTINDKTIANNIFVKNNFAFSRAINDKTLFDVNAFYSNDKKKNQKDITATKPFLDLNFIDNNYVINQNRKTQNNNFGYNASLQFKFKENTLNINSGSIFENTTYLNIVQDQDSFYNNLDLKTNDSYLGFKFTYRPKKIINYSLGLSHHYIIKKLNDTSNFNRHYFFPKIDIKAIFNTNNVLGFSYQFSTKFPVVENLLQRNVIIDYRNYNSNEDVLYNSELPYHQLNLNYFMYKPATTFIFNADYNKQENALSINNINSENSSQTLYKLSPYEKLISGMYFLEKRITNLYSFTNSTSVSKSNKIVFTDNNTNNYQTDNISFLAQLSSKYKSFPINFEIGTLISQNKYQYGRSNSFLNEKRFFSNFNGKVIKNVFYNLNLTYDHQKSTTSSTEIINLSPRIRYNKMKSKWDFSLSGNNILNIDNPIRIENNSTPSYFQEKKYSALAGYILLEIKYKL